VSAATDRALIEAAVALLAARLPAAIGVPLRDYSPIVLDWVWELLASWDARKVEVSAGPGVVPAVTVD
jgi:hypothetical protein